MNAWTSLPFAIACLILGACTAQKEPQLEVRFGEGIGELDFGVNSEIVIDYLGKPQSTQGRLLDFYPLGIAVGLSIDNRVNGFLLTKKFKGTLPNGNLLMSMRVSEIKSRWGEPTKTESKGISYSMNYPQIGAIFVFAEDALETVVMRPIK